MPRIAHGQADEKTVKLGFRQKLCAGGTGRILGCDYDKRNRQAAGLPLHAGLTLFHDFQKGGLGFGRSPVDFISQKQIRKDGSFLKFKSACAAVVHGKTQQVTGQNVGCELHSPVVQGEYTGEGGGEGGLSHAGNIFH